MTLSVHPHPFASAQPLLSRVRGDPTYQAFWLLRIAFTVAPVLFGLDKFLNLLVDWDVYMAPVFADNLPGTASELMYPVGVVEIAAGLLVAFRPRVGALAVAGWLGGIILNLLLIPDFYDIALRDFGLLLGALTLARLAAALDGGTPSHPGTLSRRPSGPQLPDHRPAS
jgi:hypothetical protein